MKMMNRMMAAMLFFATLINVSQPAYATLPSGIDSLEISGGFTLSREAPPPFWMWANKSGRVNLENKSSLFTRLRMSKLADEKKSVDWFYGVDLTARTNGNPDLVWTDGYAGLSFRNLILTVGRRVELFGLVDPVFSAGPEVYSRNAPTIPKIALSTNGYVGLTDWLAFNAYFAHGWMGDDFNVKNLYLHQKYLYLRLGDSNPDQGVNLYGGIHDLALWGGEGQPSSLSDFAKVIAGERGGANASGRDQFNSLGDHRGTIEFALLKKGHEHDWLFYAQTMFEDGSGLRFWYPGDYLIGTSLINKNPASHFVRINLELLDTRSDGNSHASRADDYLNGQYGGWVHDGFGIGTPFIPFVKGVDNSFTALNRVRAINAGVLMRFSDLVNPLVRVAKIDNYGSFDAPLSGDQKTSIYALDLTNTSTIAKGWTLTQQLSLDAGSAVKPNPAFGLTIAKKIE